MNVLHKSLGDLANVEAELFRIAETEAVITETCVLAITGWLP
jgi:hypothetical protein